MASDVIIIREYAHKVSWRAVADGIAAGDGGRLVGVGDKIPLVLKNGEQVTLVAVHEDPYWENSVVFTFEDCLKDEHVMNELGGYQNGYESSDMRRHLTNNILSLLPDELLAVIQPRTIKQRTHGGAVHRFTDKLWLMSQTEMFGSSTIYKYIDINDIQFDYFRRQKNRVKCVNGCPSWYWLRTPVVGSDRYVRLVTADGSLHFINAFNCLGVAPAFIIGAAEPKNPVGGE